MRISDWSSDVCSSDLRDFPENHERNFDEPSVQPDRRDHDRSPEEGRRGDRGRAARQAVGTLRAAGALPGRRRAGAGARRLYALERHLAGEAARADRKSVVEGKSVSVRVVLGGRRSIQKKKVYK